MKNREGENPVRESWMEIRNEFVKCMPDWVKDTPNQIRGRGVKEGFDSVIQSLAASKKSGKPAKIKFRSKKSPNKSLYIPKSAIGVKGIYPKILGKLRYSETLPQQDKICDSRLVYECGHWYLNVSYKTTATPIENQGRIVALDPGIRSFFTFFAQDSCGYLAYDDFGRIQRLCNHLDDLVSRTSKETGWKRSRMRQAQMRMRKKIKSLVDELHWKTANFLVKNFDVILLPTFETSQMVKKGKRRLRKKSVRAMLTWSHYTFKVRLKQKALEYGKRVIDVTEEYTSKTVSWNGNLVNVGGSRVIESDGIRLDRDLNGARNIFIKSLTDKSVASIQESGEVSSMIEANAVANVIFL